MLDLGYDSQHLVNDKIKQALRVDWADLLPAHQDTDDRPECIYKLLALIIAVVKLEEEVDKRLPEVFPVWHNFKSWWW